MRAAAVRQRAEELRAEGLSYAKCAARMNAEGLTSASGGKIFPTTVSRMMRTARLDRETERQREAARRRLAA